MSKNMKYIAYLRVSTNKQDHGLDAQLNTINNWIEARSAELLLPIYKEMMSGKNDDRPVLMEAVEQCKKYNATLLIAKLDRLSRNVSFLFALKDAGVAIACCDLPDLNTLTLGIFATMAQHERELISKRTKEGLVVARAKGKIIGRPKGYKVTCDIKERNKKISQTKSLKNLDVNKRLHGTAKYLKDQGHSLYSIAKQMNAMKMTSPTGKKIQATTILRLLKNDKLK